MKKIDESKLRASQLEVEKAELEKKLHLIQSKAVDIQELKASLKAIQNEGWERVLKVIDGMDNQTKKAFLKTVIEGRLTVNKKGEPSGTYNFEKGYEWLQDFTSGTIL
jgi:hypothetical protein